MSKKFRIYTIEEEKPDCTVCDHRDSCNTDNLEKCVLAGWNQYIRTEEITKSEIMLKYVREKNILIDTVRRSNTVEEYNQNRSVPAKFLTKDEFEEIKWAVEDKN